ncbi:MAG: PaaI family thioesterase [Hyphomicrobiales bacterium]
MNERLESLRTFIDPNTPKAPVARLIGLEVVDVEPGKAVMALEASSRHWNPMGTLHGGILADLADAAMGIAYTSTLEADESFTTLELKINFLRPVRQARLTATARVVQRGRSVGLAECNVVDEAGRLVAHATSTCMTLRGQQAEGRQLGDWQAAEGAAAG